MITNYVNKASLKTNVPAILLAFVGAYFLFPSIFDMGVYPLDTNNYLSNALDSSWIITLNYANINNWVWGKDIAFTYGPLGSLAMRIGWGSNRFSILLFDLFYFLNFFVIFYVSFKKSVNKILTALAIILSFLLIPTIVGGNYAIVLFIFLIFYIRQQLDKPQWYFYVVQTILLLLLIFIKFNTGLISVVLFYAMLAYLGITKRQKMIALIVYAVIPLALIFIAAKVMNVSMYGYIISGMELVSGYNEVMYLNLPGLSKLLMFARVEVALSVVTLSALFYFRKSNRLYSIFLLGLLSIGLYISYKQAFVRNDVGHSIEFFRYMPLLLLCFNEFFSEKIKNFATIPTLSMLCISFFMCNKYFERSMFAMGDKVNKSAYFQGFKDFTPTSGYHLIPNNSRLPADVASKIGKNTVDTYPWNLYMLYENELNYMPRPVLQSYASYTKYLEDLNFAHFNSDKAPQFVIYDYEGIENRYALFDEPKVNLVLLKNYQLVSSFPLNGRTLLLLEKKKNARPIKLEFLKEYAMYTDSRLVPEKGIYYEIGFYSNLGGKIKSVLDHAPEIRLAVKTGDNKITDYKSSKPMLQSGLFSDRVVRNVEDFKSLMANDTTDNNKRVKEYDFLPQSGYYKDKMRITEYKIIPQ
ncbi:hypothetical protein [Flavobacterium sp. 3HN19-14]|uniref:hypothetical protein n=1 Tax=Flavobacterium sp. 3HN19-14 TaxID=3448133 RepID=UPI003EE0ED55